MRTTELHRAQPTLTDFDATVVEVHALEDGTTDIELNRTAFYARSGGQAGDRGLILLDDDEYVVVDTRYSPDRGTVFHRIARDAPFHGAPGVTVSGRVDPDRRDQLTIGHTAQHLAYLASVMALGPRPSTGGTIDIDNIRVDIAHSSDEGTIDPQAVRDAYLSLVDADLEIRRSPDADDSSTWWWAIEGHEPIGCGGTHLTHTGGARLLEPAIKRKGSKNAVIKLTHPHG